MYNQDSYKKHEDFINRNADDHYINQLYDENSPIFHYNNVFFRNLDPIIENESKWLTIGDSTGIDAAYIQKKGDMPLPQI